MDKNFQELYKEIIHNLYERSLGKTPSTRSGDYLEGADGAYLGVLTTNKYDAASISNPYGPYGSVYSSTSIFNKFSPYGSPYSSKSPFNPYSQEPPKIFQNGKFTGLLTKNKLLPKAKDPEVFLNEYLTNANLNNSSVLRALLGR